MSAAFTNTPDPGPDPRSNPTRTPVSVASPERLRALLRERTPDRLVLDVETVATVLYVSPFTPREWRRMGPVHLAGYVAGLVADPRFRVAELVALVSVTAPSTGGAGARFAAARRCAGRVVAALSN
ncbi:hypothetical protein [Actinophytocola sediminis]